MIVRNIAVEGWRCYLKRVSVGSFDEQLNVIYAPNATGKSTLFEALRRAFVDSHRVSGEAIEAIKPWGRELAPKVTVEFVHRGAEYRITKQFLRNPSSLLERKEKGRFAPFREGVLADEWLRELLLSRPPGKGPARPENWGVAQILWAPQGNLALGELSENLVDRVRLSLGMQLSTPESSALERQIKALYETIYTPKGKLKTGRDASPMVRVKEELREIESRLQEAKAKYQRYEVASRKVEELRMVRDQAEREAQELRKTLDSARAQAEQYKELLAKKDQSRKEVESAQARYQDLKRQLDQIKATGKDLAEAEHRLGKLNVEIPVVEREIASCRKTLAQAKYTLEDVRRNRRAAEEARNVAEEARVFVENQKQLSAWGKTLVDIRTAQHALDELELQRAALCAPDVRTLKKIREAYHSRQDAKKNIELSLITLEIVPKRDTLLEVMEGLPSKPERAVKGTPVQIKGSPQVVVDLPGVARLRAWGPVQSMELSRKALAHAEQNFRKLTQAFGTNDIQELERRREQADELEKKISGRKTELTTLTEGRMQPELFVREILHEIARLEAIQQETLSRHPEWRSVSPQAEVLGRAAREAYQAYSEKEEQAAAEYENAQNALNVAEKSREKLLAEIEAQKNLVSRFKSSLDRLTSDGKTDEERERLLTELAMEWHAAKAGMEKLEGSLSLLTPDTVRTVEKLEKQLEALMETARKARDEANVEEGQLRALAADGPYSELARLEEEFTELEKQLQEEELRAAAVRLLYETVEDCRTKALTFLTEPVERTATRMLHRIAGGQLGTLELGEQFQPKCIYPVQDFRAALESVSGGEWEQIHLVTRLALAEVLAKEERQLMVWDDLLLSTDMTRLAKVLTLMEEAADRLQLVIITCHPEKYRGLSRAHFIDLEAIVRAA